MSIEITSVPDRHDLSVECVVEAPTYDGSNKQRANAHARALPASRKRKHPTHHKRRRHKKRIRRHGNRLANSASNAGSIALLADFGTATFTRCGATSQGSPSDAQLGAGSVQGLAVVRNNMFRGSVLTAETGLAGSERWHVERSVGVAVASPLGVTGTQNRRPASLRAWLALRTDVLEVVSLQAPALERPST